MHFTSTKSLPTSTAEENPERRFPSTYRCMAACVGRKSYPGGCDFYVFHDLAPLVLAITRLTLSLLADDLVARENGSWVRLTVSRCPRWVMGGGSAQRACFSTSSVSRPSAGAAVGLLSATERDSEGLGSQDLHQRVDESRPARAEHRAIAELIDGMTQRSRLISSISNHLQATDVPIRGRHGNADTLQPSRKTRSLRAALPSVG
jgi:hypothetical protein